MFAAAHSGELTTESTDGPAQLHATEWETPPQTIQNGRLENPGEVCRQPPTYFACTVRATAGSSVPPTMVRPSEKTVSW